MSFIMQQSKLSYECYYVEGEYQEKKAEADKHFLKASLILNFHFQISKIKSQGQAQHLQRSMVWGGLI